MMRASGTFQVELLPLPTPPGREEPPLGRRSIDKRFEGDLTATSRGEMLSAGTPVKGSAGYVAIEQVTGELGGKKGSFLLQHSGIMDRGEGNLTISIVPDSGTEQLTGIKGLLEIKIADGKHHYTLDYTLGEEG